MHGQQWHILSHVRLDVVCRLPSIFATQQRIESEDVSVVMPLWYLPDRYASSTA